MEELEVVLFNYESCHADKNPKKTPIQNALTSEFKKLYEQNLKNKLNQWRYFKEDNVDIDSLRCTSLNRLQYLNVMENHVSSLLNECRSKLSAELKDIEFCARKKENDRKRSEKGDNKERRIEASVLKRLNTMPEDVVGVIGEFLFGPNMRHVLITSKYLPDLFVFKKVRMPKLKIMARHISLKIQVIGQKIMKNKNIMNSIPIGHEERTNIYTIANCRKSIRESVRKPAKIKEISTFIESCEQAIRTVERIGFPNTTKNCYVLLNKIYHLMILASKPQYNKR
uniref:Uncharacterized protein n=1 Tax=viral metagenome TaxID=1070528 RepID=A0A6C0B3A8_9ZZZZ